MELLTAENGKNISKEIIKNIDRNNFKQACAGIDTVIKQLYGNTLKN